MSEQEQKFLVWYDNLLEEYFAIPKNEAPQELLAELKREKLVLHDVSAFSSTEALDTIFPHRKPEPEEVFYSRPQSSMRLH